MGKVPFISKKQMKKLDELMVEEFGILVMQMMELAGLQTALLSKKILGKKSSGKIVVLCGKGNNGGDGLVAARHLINFGANVCIVFPFNPQNLKGVPKHQFLILKKMKAKMIQYKKEGQINSLLKQSDLVIDALIGYNLNGNPRGLFADLINDTNCFAKKVLSVDVPSGLDSDTGKSFEPCIKASATLSLSLPKIGLKKNRSFSGKIFAGYMGVPKQVFKKIGLKEKNFYTDKLIERI